MNVVIVLSKCRGTLYYIASTVCQNMGRFIIFTIYCAICTNGFSSLSIKKIKKLGIIAKSFTIYYLIIVICIKIKPNNNPIVAK